ncbi:MAG TPA: hypothetical protein H9812_00625 [Candidatus Gallimonas intestinigallinarum]|uniref:Uncharacterized protein n=1 Tax=Candidatus Gallimonas intestinigallinarum TaxID=2838604 RepID=A0A9D2IUQ8_9FIRM|nr:hypothetical protein [Candidatus Gallimonas intestinigallinarum]
MRDKERLESILRHDKAIISEACEAAAVRDFAHVAEEYFELDGELAFSVREERGKSLVTLSFRVNRVKNFTQLR